MALYRNIDGVRVEMTLEEESQTRAEWAENLAKPRPDPLDSRLNGDPFYKVLLEELALISGEDVNVLTERIRTKLQLIL